jgi:regulatory protein
MGFAPLSLKARALRLLAQREHSRSELASKLARHVQEGDDLPALLDWLQARDFINAERVAQSVLHRRAPRLGVRRVLQELRGKGLDEELVRAAGRQLADSELERVGPEPATALPERARQMRFLAARGFDADTVRRVVRGGADAN